MSKYNFQAWLKQKISDDPEVTLAGKLEYLRLYLTDAMREIRTKVGLTQAQLAEKLGVQQAAVSKLESPLKEHEIESVLHYLHTLEADLLVAVKHEEDLYQVSENEEVLLIDIPVNIEEKAAAVGMNIRQYVWDAIAQYSPQKRDIRQVLTQFFESDDSVAVKVRERLGEKAIPEIAIDLEKCFSLSNEDDRLYAVKNILASSFASAGSNRDTGDENDEIAILDLAEELLEKLAVIIKK
jgi:transcriptional regulator with XRE-family HTH domain